MSIVSRVREGIEVFRLVAPTFRASMGDTNAWEATIKRFEASDRSAKRRDHPIVFVGSSSFTLWRSMDKDLAPLPIVNRGFGGSRIDEVARYARRIVSPLEPRAVVLFAGTNDIAGKHPATAEQVFDGFRAFVRAVRNDARDLPIYYVSITPSPLRWTLWPIAREANRMIEEFIRGEHAMRFIDLTDRLLDAHGEPDRSLYRFDKLHPNAAGYARWISAIKPVLMRDFPQR